jgi:hypothetical protein
MVKPQTIFESVMKAGSDAKKYPLVFLHNNHKFDSNDLPFSTSMIKTRVLVKF